MLKERCVGIIVFFWYDSLFFFPPLSFSPINARFWEYVAKALIERCVEIVMFVLDNKDPCLKKMNGVSSESVQGEVRCKKNVLFLYESSFFLFFFFSLLRPLGSMQQMFSRKGACACVCVCVCACVCVCVCVCVVRSSYIAGLFLHNTTLSFPKLSVFLLCAFFGLWRPFGSTRHTCLRRGERDTVCLLKSLNLASLMCMHGVLSQILCLYDRTDSPPDCTLCVHMSVTMQTLTRTRTHIRFTMYKVTHTHTHALSVVS